MAVIPPFEEWNESEPLCLNDDDLSFLKKLNDDTSMPTINIITENEKSFRLKATSWVGTIKIPNHIIRIKPKIGNLNFVKMLVYTEDWDDINFKEELVQAEEGKDFVDIMAKLFVELVDNIIQEGIYKNYALLEEEMPTIRGKLLIAKNIRNPRISQEKFWCEYDELSPNMLENQILLYCSKVLSGLVADKSIKGRIDQIQYVFQKEGVSEAFIDLYHLDMIHYQRFNERYEKALKICEFILGSLWYKDLSKEGEVLTYGIMCNMSTLFQNFVIKSVKEVFPQFYVKKEPRDKKLLQEICFKEAGTKQVSAKVLKPDMVICDNETKKACLIIDTKYKKDPVADDFYQSLAYSLVFDCPAMLLLPQLDVKKRGDFKLVEGLDKSAFIFTRMINLSEAADLDYIVVIKKRLKKIIDSILQSSCTKSRSPPPCPTRQND